LYGRNKRQRASELSYCGLWPQLKPQSVRWKRGHW